MGFGRRKKVWRFAGRRLRTGRVFWILLVLASGLFLLPAGAGQSLQLSFLAGFCRPLWAQGMASEAGDREGDCVRRDQFNRCQNYLANVTMELVRTRAKLKQLSQVADRRPLEGAAIVFADVITRLCLGGSDELVINRGADDGLKHGQVVLGDNCVIGRVSAVSFRTAKVMLVTDTGSRTAVCTEAGTDARFMQGNGNGRAKLLHMSSESRLSPGQLLYMCAEPGFLDSSMVAGQVVRCERDAQNPLLWDADVEPACRLDQLRTVMVLVINPHSALVKN